MLQRAIARAARPHLMRSRDAALRLVYPDIIDPLPWFAAPVCPAVVTLDDLKKLEIICYVPSYLPKGFKLRSVTIASGASDEADNPTVAHFARQQTFPELPGGASVYLCMDLPIHTQSRLAV